MAEDAFTRVSKLLNDSDLRSNPTAAGRDEGHRATWRRAAGDAVADHTVINIDSDIWNVIADAPIWGHAVRQRESEILETLARENVRVRALKIQVRPQKTDPVKAPEAPHGKLRSLDEKSATLLSSAADSLKSSGLAEAVKRLSQHRSPK